MAITAPANCVVDAHPPTPPASSATTATPAKRWRRIERREAAASFCIDRSSDIRDHLQGPQRQSRLMSYHLGRDLILGPKGLRASLIHHQQMVDRRERARPVRDDDDDTASTAHAENSLRERLLADRVEVGAGLVEHHQERV